MRKLVALLGLGLLTTVSEFAAAQTPLPDFPVAEAVEPQVDPVRYRAPEYMTAQALEPEASLARPNRYRNIRRAMTVQERLIQQRAMSRAIQREARLQARKWTGRSPLRPTITDGHYSQDLNGYAWRPHGGYYVLSPGW